MLCCFSSFKHSDTFGRIRIMQIKIKHAGSSTWQLHPDKELFNHKTLAVKVTEGPCGMCAGTDRAQRPRQQQICVSLETCKEATGSSAAPKLAADWHPCHSAKSRLGESPSEILETETATCKLLLPHGRLRKPCYNLLTLWHVGQGSSKVWI